MSIRGWLRDELARRRARNRRYSLRAFARDLAMHHATLSRILRGQRITKATLAKLAARVAVPDPSGALRAEADAAVFKTVTRRGFRADSRWIATRTGVCVDDVNAAIHRLLRAGRLQLVAVDRWLVMDTSV